MLPTSLALAWPLWRRHRLGLFVVLGFLIGAALLVFAVTRMRLDSKTVNILLGPLTLGWIAPTAYLLAIFCLGFDVDISARESCFPASFFRLPVRTAALAGWPIAYGAAAAVVLWLATAWFILRPWLELWDLQVSFWWPAALSAATIAWFQAILWIPVGLPGLRIVLAAILIPGLVVLASYSVESGRSESFLVSLFAVLTGLGWMVAYAGVRRARRGAVPDWKGVFAPLQLVARVLPRSRRPFACAERAQVWFEWRRTGLALPIMTALVLPFALMPLLFGKNDAIPTARTLLSVLAFPVLLAGLAGTTVSGRHPWVKDYYGVAPFAATLPLTTARMIAAKLKAAALSTLLTWGLLVGMASAAVVLTGNQQEVADWWQEGVDTFQPAKVIAGIAGAALWLVLWTWKRLVDSLVLGLTGRKWIIQLYLYAGVTLVAFLGVAAAMIYKSPETHETLLTLLPWLLGLWIISRMLLTGWALRHVFRQKLVEPRTVWRWLLAWLLLAAALLGVLAWVVPRELVPVYYLPFIVLLAMPLAHLAAGPLALAWNRHR